MLIEKSTLDLTLGKRHLAVIPGAFTLSLFPGPLEVTGFCA